MSRKLMKNAAAWRSIFGVAASLWFGTHAQAAVLSFNGSFTADDNVQLQSFAESSPSLVALQTSSYAAGGFDPIVAVFDATGALIGQNDDGAGAPPDPSTGEALDALLTLSLTPGQYTVSLTQFDNFPVGPTLADGFVESGMGNFTAALFDCGAPNFCDVTGSARTNQWALTISSVAVSEPSTMALFTVSLACFGAVIGARILGRHFSAQIANI